MLVAARGAGAAAPRGPTGPTGDTRRPSNIKGVGKPYKTRLTLSAAAVTPETSGARGCLECGDPVWTEQSHPHRDPSRFSSPAGPGAAPGPSPEERSPAAPPVCMSKADTQGSRGPLSLVKYSHSQQGQQNQAMTHVEDTSGRRIPAVQLSLHTAKCKCAKRVRVRVCLSRARQQGAGLDQVPLPPPLRRRLSVCASGRA